VLRNGVSPILAVSKRLYQEKGLGKVVPVVANPLKLVSEFLRSKVKPAYLRQQLPVMPKRNLVLADLMNQITGPQKAKGNHNLAGTLAGR
jgi:hypothetical protein